MDLMVEVIQLVARCLEPVKPLAHVLLLLDCAPVHTTQRVVAAAARAGFLLHFVPTLMTSELHPLDVYVFAQFKKVFRDYYEELAMASATGEVSQKKSDRFHVQSRDDRVEQRSMAACSSRV